MRQSGRSLFRVTFGTAIALLAVMLLSTDLLEGQAPTGKGKTATGPAKAATNKGKDAAAKADAKGKAAARPPLLKADVETLWKQGNGEVMLNEIRLRTLGFEPEEDWLKALPNPTAMPGVMAELQSKVPAAPDPDAVASQAAELLTRLKTATQARDDNAMRALVHPELMTEKARIYDLFDATNYRDHSLGRFAPAPNRRVGVQFFQLTTSQVERLHYVEFATSGGKIVVREIATGPALAARFLEEERKLALSKLDLMFRAMNDGDDSGLRNLCTPGLYESIKELAGGARLLRGTPLSVGQANVQASVPLDQKSIRVVTRVTFNSRSGLRIEFDVDFERINNDLKVVRVRDVLNRVIAWDPDVDNYLNRRFGLPDGEKLPDPPQGKTQFLHFQPIATIRQLAMNALYDGSPELTRYAQELSESLPDSGEGLGFVVASSFLAGKYDEVETQRIKVLEGKGTVYYPVLHHKAFNGKEFWPVILAVSADKVTYIPLQGSGSEEIPVSSIEKAARETVNRLEVLAGKKPRPFINLEFKKNGKTEKYNFAAIGTYCPVTTPVPPPVLNPRPYDLATVASVCPQQQGQGGGLAGFGAVGPMIGPTLWERNLTTIIRTIEDAKKRSGQKK